MFTVGDGFVDRLKVALIPSGKVCRLRPKRSPSRSAARCPPSPKQRAANFFVTQFFCQIRYRTKNGMTKMKATMQSAKSLDFKLYRCEVHVP